jgi:hypothetical protein
MEKTKIGIVYACQLEPGKDVGYSPLAVALEAGTSDRLTWNRDEMDSEWPAGRSGPHFDLETTAHKIIIT